MKPTPEDPYVAIACGGTGGHLFPGIAVADAFLRRGIKSELIISAKEIDREATRGVANHQIVSLVSSGWRDGALGFLRGLVADYQRMSARFLERTPVAVLGMGGFSCAAPALAAMRHGVPLFFHESNAVPGRATRWFSRFCLRVFLGFPDAAAHLSSVPVVVTGTPVRNWTQFQPGLDRAGHREQALRRLGITGEVGGPVLLVIGGSQGAAFLNRLVPSACGLIKARWPGARVLHVAGPREVDSVRYAYEQGGVAATVWGFCHEMDALYRASDAAVVRAGASTLAELAAFGLPGVLIPYAAAADQHQFFNAMAYQETGAGRILEESEATPEALVVRLLELLEAGGCSRARAALRAWDSPGSADRVAGQVVSALRDQRVPEGWAQESLVSPRNLEVGA